MNTRIPRDQVDARRRQVIKEPRPRRRDIRKWHDSRTRAPRHFQFIVSFYDSEMVELTALAQHYNRTIGEQMRALLHTAIRQFRSAPNWTPPELDTERTTS